MVPRALTGCRSRDREGRDAVCRPVHRGRHRDRLRIAACRKYRACKGFRAQRRRILATPAAARRVQAGRRRGRSRRRAAEGRAALLKRPRRPRKSSESPVFPDVCVGDIRRDCCILARFWQRLRERARARRQEASERFRAKWIPVRVKKTRQNKRPDRSREGRTMNDDDRRESGRLMLISPERVFYAGLLGRPRKRAGGGFSIYAAMHGSLRITEGKSETVGEVAVVPPYVT